MLLRNILSLFDGISCGSIALDKAGIEYEEYYAVVILCRAGMTWYVLVMTEVMVVTRCLCYYSQTAEMLHFVLARSQDVGIYYERV